jgi:hypothetical protein
MSFISSWIGDSLSYIGGYFYSNTNTNINTNPIESQVQRISLTPFSFATLPDDCIMSNDIEINDDIESEYEDADETDILN